MSPFKKSLRGFDQDNGNINTRELILIQNTHIYCLCYERPVWPI